MKCISSMLAGECDQASTHQSPVRPELSTRGKEKKKLPSSSSSSPALIAYRMQSTVVSGQQLLGTGFCSRFLRVEKSWLVVDVGKMTGWGVQTHRGRIVPWCVNVLKTRECSPALALSLTLSHSRWLCVYWSGFPTLTVRSALPLTSHLKGEGLISRWWLWAHTHTEKRFSLLS